MRTIIVDKLPKCDICGHDALYDAPARNGSWANMCRECYGANASSNAATMATMFSTKGTTDNGSHEPVKGKSYYNPEDDERTIECPLCGHVHLMEVDGEGPMPCHNCGVSLLFRALF